MYEFLLKYLPVRWANVGITLWYSLLILLILFLLKVDEADFRYVNY